MHHFLAAEVMSALETASQGSASVSVLHEKGGKKKQNFHKYTTKLSTVCPVFYPVPDESRKLLKNLHVITIKSAKRKQSNKTHTRAHARAGFIFTESFKLLCGERLQRSHSHSGKRCCSLQDTRSFSHLVRSFFLGVTPQCLCDWC